MLRAFRLPLVLLASGIVSGAAAAHDFWLQPRSWQVAPGVDLPFVVEVGHGPFREQWGSDAGHLLQLREQFGDRSSRDLRSLFKPGGEVPHLTTGFRQPGLHIVSLVSNDALSVLPGIRFTDYLKEEGLTPALDRRAQTNATNATGRELYSRRAKALVQVGAGGPDDDAVATRPIGLTLEIVPLRNPYALGSDRILPVKVLYEGKPLGGALVKLTSLEFDVRPLAAGRTDALGRATFKVPPVGSWLVNVIWTKPVAARDADFQTIFSSLTFGYPARKR